MLHVTHENRKKQVKKLKDKKEERKNEKKMLKYDYEKVW